MSWFWQAITSVVLVVPAWLCIRFYSKNLDVAGGIFMVWYFVGGAIGGAIIGHWNRTPVVHPPAITLSIVLIGLTLGAGSNYIGFQSVTAAPNPGLAIAITTSASALVYLASVALGRTAPRYFEVMSFDLNQFIGILLVIAGTIFIALKK